MATLEVHDGRGRVEYVVISREGTTLLGSDPKCDVVIDDPESLPVHGRIFWKRKKFRVEAITESRFLLVNGRKMAKSGLRQGDEIAIGDYRIFLLNEGEGSPDTEKTQVREQPAAAARLESTDWLKDIEVAPPSLEEQVEPEPAGLPTAATGPGRSRTSSRGAAGRGERPRSRWGLLKSLDAPAAAPVEAERPKASWLVRSSRVLVGAEQAPGQERILRSPLVLGLAAALIILGLMSVALWGIIIRQAANGAFRRATDALVDRDYREAILAFDRFLELAPDDERASEARVRRSLAGVQRFLTGGEAAWTQALEAAQAMHRDTREETAFDDVRAEAADVVLSIAEGLAERARRAADRADLARIDDAVALHDALAGAAAPSLRERARLPGRIAAAQAAIRKAEAREEALAEMDAALGQGSASGIYRARDALVAAYPDLADDRGVLERMNRANDLLRAAVTHDPSTRPALTEARPEPSGPTTTFIVRSGPNHSGGAEAPSGGPVVFALVEGFAYGLSAVDGSPLWQRPVGRSSPFPPVVAGVRGESALVVDARHDELVRLDAATGELRWRQPLGEPVTAAPMVQGNHVVQVAPSGKVYTFDLDNGALRGTLDLGVPLGPSPVTDEFGGLLYIVAERSVLFIVARDPPSCVAVAYLGHDAGSIPGPPVRVGRYLVVAENHRLNEGRWRIFLLEQEGKALRPLQRIDVPGWTWDAPATRGSVIWALGDVGGLTAYAIGGGQEASPLRAIAGVQSEAAATGPSYLRARTEREVWMASNRAARYDLNPERGELSAAWALVDVGPARAPIQAAGRLVIFTQQAADGAGTELIGVNSSDGSVAWRTTLGAPWPVAPVADPAGDALATLGPDGRPLAIPRETLESGGFVARPRPAPAAFRLPPRGLDRLVRGGLSVVIPSAGASELLVGDGSGPLREVPLPSAMAATPAFRGDDLIVPGDDGLVYLIDPRTGASRADPYVPPYEADRPYRWLAPAPIDGDRVAMVDAEGRVRLLDLQEGPRRRLVGTGDEIDLGSPPTADPAASDGVLVVATADGRVRALAASDLSPLGAWPTAARPAVGPVRVGDDIFVVDAAGLAMLIGPDGQRRWAIEFPDGPPVGPPAVVGDVCWFLDGSGSLLGLSMLDGTLTDRVPLEALPTDGPVALGDSLVLPVAPGVVGFRAASSATEITSLEPTDHAGR